MVGAIFEKRDTHFDNSEANGNDPAYSRFRVAVPTTALALSLGAFSLAGNAATSHETPQPQSVFVKNQTLEEAIDGMRKSLAGVEQHMEQALASQNPVSFLDFFFSNYKADYSLGPGFQISMPWENRVDAQGKPLPGRTAQDRSMPQSYDDIAQNLINLIHVNELLDGYNGLGMQRRKELDMERLDLVAHLIHLNQADPRKQGRADKTTLVYDANNSTNSDVAYINVTDWNKVPETFAYKGRTYTRDETRKAIEELNSKLLSVRTFGIGKFVVDPNNEYFSALSQGFSSFREAQKSFRVLLDAVHGLQSEVEKYGAMNEEQRKKFETEMQGVVNKYGQANLELHEAREAVGNLSEKLREYEKNLGAATSEKEKADAVIRLLQGQIGSAQGALDVSRQKYEDLLFDYEDALEQNFWHGIAENILRDRIDAAYKKIASYAADLREYGHPKDLFDDLQKKREEFKSLEAQLAELKTMSADELKGLRNKIATKDVELGKKDLEIKKWKADYDTEHAKQWSRVGLNVGLGANSSRAFTDGELNDASGYFRIGTTPSVDGKKEFGIYIGGTRKRPTSEKSGVPIVETNPAIPGRTYVTDGKTVTTELAADVIPEFTYHFGPSKHFFIGGGVGVEVDSKSSFTQTVESILQDGLEISATPGKNKSDATTQREYEPVGTARVGIRFGNDGQYSAELRGLLNYEGRQDPNDRVGFNGKGSIGVNYHFRGKH